MPDTVFELRNYTMQPAQRDVLIELFEREFIEAQEAFGGHVWATFRNLDDPNRFVWLRGFADLSARYAALDGFYACDTWRAHREAANATIIDSDDVLLLRPVSGTVERDPASRPPISASRPAETTICVTTYFLPPNGGEDFAAFFADGIAPHLRDTGVDRIATFASEPAENNYPRLPVRTDTVFVAVTRARIALTPALDAEVRRRVIASTETLRLQPTARSLLR